MEAGSNQSGRQDNESEGFTASKLKWWHRSNKNRARIGQTLVEALAEHACAVGRTWGTAC